jgi:16S rRNA (guanine(966)-N(2))-methyltransferase RsmD
MRIIAGEARGRRLLSPRDRSVRPPLDRIRESIFSILSDSFEGSAVLDLFAGTGSFGLEALSRGASRALFVDNAKASLEIIERNLELTGFWARAEVLRGNAVRLPDLGSFPASTFGLVFLDPPFGLFQEDGPTQEFVARVEEIRRSDALRPEGTVVLRCPSGGPLTAQAFSGSVRSPRTYGESVVFHLEKALEDVE